MQTDMHYYGTYAMARAAGLSEEDCYLIAYAAQFVDDNAAGEFVEFDDGARIDTEATAHHPVDIKNVGQFDPEDQRKVWVPFHFLPGNEGAEYSERLRCVKDSLPAQEMIQNHADHVDKAFGLYLVGIAAHVYADTFSHYGFSGISSEGNKVDQNSIELRDIDAPIREYIEGKAEKFFEKETARVEDNPFKKLYNMIRRKLDMVQAKVAELGGALGHGPVATYPDRPFLTWQFNYEQENQASGVRNNPATFLDGCKKLHQIFAYVKARVERDTSRGGSGKSFEYIQSSVETVLKTEAGKQGRIDAWQKAARSGAFGIAAPIPEYDHNHWKSQWEDLKANHTRSNQAIDTDIFKFYCAAAYHRNYVIRDLLPKYGLVID
ncbi:MAG: hypothetical protein KBT54_08000 [Amphritea sp.]|nr:hypothetical protein [Amphritea sp.]